MRFHKYPRPLLGAFLLLFLRTIGSVEALAQAPSFVVAPRHTEVRIGEAFGVGAVVSGSGTASYVWRKSGVVVESGSAVAANDWKSVVAGASHALALKNDGSLWGWGSNAQGQLGSGEGGFRNAPGRIGTDSDWSQLFARGDRSGAIKRDGTVWFCGGAEGLADPVRVPGNLYFESAAFGEMGTMYLISLGGLYSFNPDMDSVPVPVGTARDWAALSIGSGDGGGMIVALKRDGTLWAYNPTAGMDPQNDANGGFQQVDSGRWKAVSAGPGYAVALRMDGTLWAWGRSGVAGGRSLFKDAYQTRYAPVQLGTRSDWKSISADLLPLAVDADGRVHEVAEGWSREVSSIPAPCRGVAGRGTDSFKLDSEGLAIGVDGTLWAWGLNDKGQLGDVVAADTFDPGGGGDANAVQVGVNRGWGLDGPVLGVPLGLSLANFQGTDLGVYELSVNNLPAVSVAVAQWTAQPESRRLIAGGSVQLFASGSLGTGSAATYQWYRNGVAISGATGPNYTLAAAQASASGVYWVEIVRGGVRARGKAASIVVEEGSLAAVHAALAAKSYAVASGSLGTILQGNPGHPSANVLKALVDVYLLIQDPRTTTMLTELGFTGSAAPFNFTLKHSGFPAGGALTLNSRNWIKDALYPKLTAADALLEKVTSTSFLSTLVASDFGSRSDEAIPFDYGDVQLARAGLNLVMSLLKWVETLNTDVSLLELKNRRNSGTLSLESVLALYPSLLSASSTASAAQTEFVSRFGRALTLYLNFSAFANPTPAAVGAKRLDAEQGVFTLTSAEDRESERRLAQNCVRLRDSIAATSAAAGLRAFSLPSTGVEGTVAYQASPWVFFKHAPGWRIELPSFKGNAYVPGTLKPETALAFYPALQMKVVGQAEAQLASAEPKIKKLLKTGRETTPPAVQLLTLSSGSARLALSSAGSLATNGWLTVSGTAADVSGVGQVVVTRTSGADVSSAAAALVERVQTAGSATRVFDWSVQLPAALGPGTLRAVASDYAGNSSSASVGVNLTAAASGSLPVVPDLAREVSVGSPAALAALVPASGTVEFLWSRNGVSLGNPLTAAAVDDWASVGVGGEHTAAIKRDGTLWSWGSNSSNQLGGGAARQSPARVGTASNWAAVSCGRNFTVALRRDGSLWASGSSPFGNFEELTAVAAANFLSWARISTADSHALALSRDGRLFLWSGGASTQVGTASDWVEVSAGGSGGRATNFAIKRDGTLWAWGANVSGVLGIGWSYYGDITAPVQVGVDTDWLTVSANGKGDMGASYTAALKKDGTLWAWGFAPFLFAGQSWNGFYDNPTGQMTPRRIGPGNLRCSGVTVSAYGLFATRLDGVLLKVGDDWGSPVEVAVPAVSVACAGSSFGMVGTDGTLWMWGDNDSGQLGNYYPKDLSDPWQDWRRAYASAPVQAGVSPDWGLASPVRGIPVPLGFDFMLQEDLGAYNLAVKRGASSTAAVASFYSWSQPGQSSLFATAGGPALRVQGGLKAGASTVSYQWFRNGAPVPGATSAELTLSAPALGNSGVYWVQAVSGKASVRGRPFAVVVDSANVTEARKALNARNFVEASSRLNLALAANPAEGAALFLRSALDLYNLWSDPGVATNLAALGFTGSADPLAPTLRWSAEGFPKGALSAPVRAWLTGTFYSKLVAAEANLAKITDTGFVTSFGPYDVGLEGEGSIVDYGDVQIVRSFLNAVMAVVKWIESQNTDVDLAALQLDRRNGRLSVESLLARYPSLLAASATGTAARTEFISRFKQMLERYKGFSDFVNPVVVSTTGQRQDPSLGTVTLEEAGDRTDERDFRDAVNKTLDSVNASDAVAGRRTVQRPDGYTVTMSPHAFVQHAPGWRSDLPAFSRNRYQRSSLKRGIFQSFYPAFSLADASAIEDALLRAEPRWNAALGTREDAAPPVLNWAPVAELSSYDGWVNIGGTVQDAAGVRRVILTLGSGQDKEVFEADLEELRPAADGTRLYEWKVAVSLSGKSAASLDLSLSAEDVFGGVVDTPLARVVPVARMVPLVVGYEGGGDVSFTVTPAADGNGFVRVGAKVALVANPRAGNLLRRIETVVDGETEPQSVVSSNTNLTIRGETVVSVVFEPNPYLRIGGRNLMAGGMIRGGTGGEERDGIFPMTAVQITLTSAGSFSGRLQVGVSTYSLSGRFDQDGCYNVRLPARFARLGWPSEPLEFRRPVLTSAPIDLTLWVDTSNGVDEPVLRAEFGEPSIGSGVLSPLGAKDHVGQAGFTGYVAGGSSIEEPVEALGVSEAARERWNRTPGWWSLAARKTGTVLVNGMLPGKGRFTCSGYLANQAAVLEPQEGTDAIPGDYADLRILTSVAANTAVRLMTTIVTPANEETYGTPVTAPYASGAVRTEMWYPGNRGPVFEAVAPGSAGTNAHTAFASLGTMVGVGYTPALPGRPLAPFVDPLSSENAPRKLAVQFAFGSVDDPEATLTKGFELQSSLRNTVAVVPGSASSVSLPQLNLNASTGVLSGGATLPGGKRVTLQGVLFQQTPPSNGDIPQSLLDVFGLGMTSDGEIFVITANEP